MRKYAGIITISMMMIAILILIERSTIRSVVDIREEQKTAISEEAELFCAIIEEDDIFNGVESWKESNGSYVLFLPGGIREETLKIYTREDMQIEGSEIKAGEFFLMNGETIVFERKGRKEVLHIMYSSDIPVLWVNTQEKSLNKINESKEYQENVIVTLWDRNVEQTVIRGRGNMHARGNVSFEAPKKSYLLEMVQNVNFISMGEAKKWILTANYFDQTLLRNYLTIQLAKRVGMTYVPETEYVDLYVDGRYIGNYLLSEKVEVGINRVEVSDLEKENETRNGSKNLKRYPYYKDKEKGFLAISPSDITGGYLLEFELDERWNEEVSGFVTNEGQSVVIQSPKYATKEEVEYISDIFQGLEDALLEPPNSNKYLEYIDLDSFIAKYLIEEICKNIDANKTSQYFYKYNDNISQKIFAGPVWDYDKAWGNGGKLDEGLDLREPEGFYVKRHIYPHSIWTELYEKDTFRKSAAERYCIEVKPILDDFVDTEMDIWKDRLLNSIKMDWRRWNGERKRETNNTEQRYVDTFEEAYGELKMFVEIRKEFLYNEWCS